MPPRDWTDGERVIQWIESWCVVPGSREQPVRLTTAERGVIYTIYDAAPWLGTSPDINGRLAAFLVLYALVGRPSTHPGAAAGPTANLFTVWAAASPDLRGYLERRGATITCPELGRSWAA